MRTLDISRRLIVITAGLAMLLLAPARERAQPADDISPRPPRAIAYAMWNQELLFLAARVDDVNLTGASTGAMSEAWRDDAVDFYLDLSGAPSDAVHAGCARVVVSAAGGFTALVGTPSGTWRAQPDWLLGLKLGVEREGTLNDPHDTDVGYTVEVGIPWRFLGGAPRPGRRIGFNFVIHVRGENETFVSWSSHARSLADLDQPGRWGSMVFNSGRRPTIADNDVIICPATFTAPLVEGRLGAGEWLTASVAQVEKPAPELVYQPTAGKPGARVLATYRYDYAVPATLRSEVNTLALAHQPPDGVGPWFSADSVAWHTSMLRQAREAAIDTILPVYAGDPEARRNWSRQGLLRLVQALKQTKDGRKSYPLVAMYLDASSLARAGAANLTSAVDKETLWGMIREFFAIIPEEFRAQFDIRDGDPANLVVLGPPHGLEAWDDQCIDYCRKMYRRTFGVRLLVLGDEGWRSRAPNLDGYCSLEPGVSLSYGKEGARPTIRLTPGYLGPSGMLPRRGSVGYEQDWVGTLAALPDFVIVDSFNDFEAGSEIARSRQYGVRFLDITRQSAQALAGRRQYQIAVLRQTLPAVLDPGATCRVEMLIENQGFQDLTESENVEISYTLQSKQRPDLRRTGIATSRLFVRAGQRAPIVVEISTTTEEGPLPVGDYELTFEVTKSTIPILRSRWFSKHLFGISLPVRIDRAPGYEATILSTSLPSTLASGARKRVRVRLRNDGSRTWRAKECALSYHWVRASGVTAGATAESKVVEFEGVRTPLPRDIKPGEMVTAYAWLEARTADGAPLPAWTPDQDWLYQVQWDLVEGADGWFSRTGAQTYAEMVGVVASDLSGTVVDSDVPTHMEAGKTYPVKVLVRNEGSTSWEAQRCGLAYRWHYWDGAQASPQSTVVPLAAPVAEGESALVRAQVRTPDFGGSYRLAWELVCEGQSALESPDRGSSCTLTVESVTVSGGPYQPLDLSEHLNVLASTFDGYGSRGAFDAAGLSFPAEFIPPDVGGPRVEDYPAIYFGGERSQDSLARVPLHYSPKDQRGAKAIACIGQRIPLPQQPLCAIYIAASGSAPAAAEFGIAYADGTEEKATMDVPAWTEPAADSVIALRAPYLRSAGGDMPTPAYIYLLQIGDIKPGALPTTLILPTAPQVKLFAITVEQQSAPTTGGS